MMTPQEATANGGCGESGRPYGSLPDLVDFVQRHRLGLIILERQITGEAGAISQAAVAADGIVMSKATAA